MSSGVTAVVCAAGLLGLDDLAGSGCSCSRSRCWPPWSSPAGATGSALVRTVEPIRIAVGQGAEVTLHLRNEGRAPTGLLLLEEQVPYALGVRPRFVIDRMGRAGAARSPTASAPTCGAGTRSAR